MQYKKTKHGLVVTVLAWSSVVTVTKKLTGEVVQRVEFSDHIQAVLAAKTI